jgi:hypothetical protein
MVPHEKGVESMKRGQNAAIGQEHMVSLEWVLKERNTVGMTGHRSLGGVKDTTL